MTKFTTAKGFSDTTDKAGSKMPDTPMGRIAGKWPGDETDEQIAEGLVSLQRSANGISQPCKECGHTTPLRMREGDRHWIKCFVCQHNGPEANTMDDAIRLWGDSGNC